MDAWNFKGLPPEGVAILSLGGNLGDVACAFKTALDGLAKDGFSLLKLSSFIRTAPEGCEEGAPDFLNAVAIGSWPGTPHSLLKACKEQEAAAGRPDIHPRWHSRSLDIDIIAFGPSSLSCDGLVLPHPLALKRRFVLEPLAEIAPEVLLPGAPYESFEALKRLGRAWKNASP